MNKLPLKMKILLFVFLVLFMAFYGGLFGSENIAIGIMIVLAAFMNLGNDFSYKPCLSFVKVLFLLLVLGIVAFLNNPISIWGCVLTFIVVFGTTFTSYHLFGNDVYMPFLMCYFMMMCVPITAQMLPMRLLSLVFGAVFIVGINILVNRNKLYKLSKQTIDKLVCEINRAIDLKLEHKKVSKKNFKIANDFYSNVFSKFEYKYFPSSVQESILNVVKSFQYIGIVLAEFDLSENELVYIKGILSDIHNVDDVFKGIEIETDELYLVLLNLEIIINEIKNRDLAKDSIVPDKKTVRKFIRSAIKMNFSFRSVKFTFAFKMAFVLTLWELLTLLFNLPFTKWLYFSTIPLMVPYIDDFANTASNRIKGTFVGVAVFTLAIIILYYTLLPIHAVMGVFMFVCIFGLVYKLEDVFILSVFSSIVSVISSLSYIPPEMGIILKLLWIVVAAIVVSIVNFGFLPYSVEKESKNNLKVCSGFNRQSIELIKQKALGDSSSKKTTLLVLNSIVNENIEVNDDNRELYELQIKISDISNFILSYLESHEISDDLKDNLVDIIDKNGEVNTELDAEDMIISYSTRYVVKLFEKEQKLLN